MKWLDKLFDIERLNLGEPCLWKDIKVGEVFGSKGCFAVFYKTSGKSVVLLDSDEKVNNNLIGTDRAIFNIANYTTIKATPRFCWFQFYKLPKATQELWLP